MIVSICQCKYSFIALSTFTVLGSHGHHPSPELLHLPPRDRFYRYSFTGTQTNSLVDGWFTAAFKLQLQRRIVAAKTTWPTKPKVLIIWSFTEESADPWASLTHFTVGEDPKKLSCPRTYNKWVKFSGPVLSQFLEFKRRLFLCSPWLVWRSPG